MSIQERIQSIRDIACKQYDYEMHDDCHPQDIIHHCDYIDSELEKSPWIPVSERLPEDSFGKLYQVRYPKQYVNGIWHYEYCGYMKTNRWTDRDGNDVPNVTHWMEIPC